MLTSIFRKSILYFIFPLISLQSSPVLSGPVPDLSPAELVLIVPFAAARSVSDSIKDKKKQRDWLKEQKKLFKAQDFEAMVSCMFTADDPENSLKLTKADQLSCAQIVINHGESQIKYSSDVIILIHAYTLLSQHAEQQQNTQDAMTYKFKALSYLRHPALSRYENFEEYERDYQFNNHRAEYKSNYNGTGFHYLRKDIHFLLGSLKTLDDETRICTYPKALQDYLSDSNREERRLLHNGCNADKTSLLQIRKWKIVWQ